MKQMTFKEIYNELPRTSPKKIWIERMAKVTKKSEHTIRMWLGGNQQPDDLAKSVLEKELGVSVDILFPSKDSN